MLKISICLAALSDPPQTPNPNTLPVPLSLYLAARLFFFFPCSADHERDWPRCKVVFFGLATNALNVRNNINNNNLLLPLSQFNFTYFVHHNCYL